MGSGIRFSLKDGYRPQTISPLDARKCWEPEFQYALRGIAGETYPQAIFALDGSDPHVVFSAVNKLGIEILRHSKSFDQRRPSSSEILRIQDEIQRLHALADDNSIPSDRREFFRNLRLPNPQYMPECWRTTGFFRKRLHIIWGLAKDGKQSTFLPASASAAEWADAKNRMPLGDTLGMSGIPSPIERHGMGGASFEPGSPSSPWSSFFKWLLAALPILLLVFLVRGCLRGCCHYGRGMAGGVSVEDAGVPDGGPGVKVTGEGSGGGSGCTDEGDSDRPVRKGDPAPVTSLEVARALSCQFKVNPPTELSGSNGEIAQVEFTVSPMGDLGGKSFTVSDWKVNNEVVRAGCSASFVPDGGLRYDRSYTITASVTIDGKRQRVEPYQWNMVDKPTWQILEVGRDETGEKRQYRLVCCNSSSVRPIVKDWRVAFRPGGRNEQKVLEFEVEQQPLGDDKLELDWGIGRYKGAYYVEMAAEIEYSIRGETHTTTHLEVFPFAHDSSADGLTKAKYEVVIPNVYFCLARLDDGSLINGTAFAVSEKLLLSNYHVAVGGIPECYANSGNYKVVGPVTLTNVKGKTFYGKVERSDRGRDLVVLRLCGKTGEEVDERLPGYLHWSEESTVKDISETSTRHVFAIGYPKGTVCMGPPAFTDGKAEKLFKRDYMYQGRVESYETIMNYTSTKCGYSGGPLIDYQTETVLGVNFGGLIGGVEGHKAASLATSVSEVRKAFPVLMKK